jgi:hypothetical protein
VQRAFGGIAAHFLLKVDAGEKLEKIFNWNLNWSYEDKSVKLKSKSSRLQVGPLAIHIQENSSRDKVKRFYFASAKFMNP